jgi:hypothetical protein
MAQTPKQRTAAKRASLAKKTHERNTKARAQDTIDKKSAYFAAKDDFVSQDILSTAKQFIAMHNKIAQDGVGARKTGHKLTNGEDEIENIYLTNNQRAGHLDKSAGIQELVDYIERQMTPVSDAMARAASGK